MRDTRQRPTITNDCVVTLHYALRLDDGRVVESTSNNSPFSYVHGSGAIVPGLEDALQNCHVGDRVEVSVPPSRGYGEVDPRLVTRVPRSSYPTETDLAVGTKVSAEIGGQEYSAWVIDFHESEVTVSFNHPLAGENLHFSVEIVGIREARPSELSSGVTRPRPRRTEETQT